MMNRCLCIVRPMGALIFATLLAVASPLPAAAQEVHAFNVATPDAASAIRAFGAQAGLQILASADDLNGKQLHPVTGDISTEQALNTLLAGTGLDHQYVGERVVALVNNGAASGAAAAPSAGGMGTGSTTAQSAKIPFSIPAQSLDAALKDFSTQSGIAISAPAALTNGIKSKGVHGTMSAMDALRRILTGSGLTLLQGSDGSIAIQANASGSQGPNQEKPDTADVTVEGQQEKEKPYSGANVDIPRTINDVQPYYIFDSQTIEMSGATNVEDFLKQQLTMNTVVQTNSQAVGTHNYGGGSGITGGNTSTINLRGLGTNETLILVDGHRMAGVNVFGSPYDQGQPDVNGLPLSAIDRIEVLPSSASAIYGGSALGGVVNIILKKNYTGGSVKATYGSTWDNHSPQESISAAYGTGFEDGKSHLLVTASYSSSEPLYVGDRIALMQRGYQTLLRNDPSYLGIDPTPGAVNSPLLGSTPNIVGYICNPNTGVCSTTNLTLKSNGHSLNSPERHIAGRLFRDIKSIHNYWWAMEFGIS